jgi:hypothetical protein
VLLLFWQENVEGREIIESYKSGYIQLGLLGWSISNWQCRSYPSVKYPLAIQPTRV